jgi:hypothetical protein
MIKSNYCCFFTQPANAFFEVFEVSPCSLVVVNEIIGAHHSNNKNLTNGNERPQHEFDASDRYLLIISGVSYENQLQKTFNDVPKREITFLNALPTSFNTVPSLI